MIESHATPNVLGLQKWTAILAKQPHIVNNRIFHSKVALCSEANEFFELRKEVKSVSGC